jgi:uncharacterized protein (TIGR02453 family)
MTKLTEFSGFNPKIYDFFNNLKVNNNKEWFDENRSFYEKEIKDNSKVFINSLAKRFSELNLPFIADPKLSLFRINRDIRFSKDKSPYKTNLGLYFPYSENHAGVKKTDSIGLYFHYQIDECFAACGIHMPDNSMLKVIRKKIADEWEDFKGIIETPEFKKAYPKQFNDQPPLKKVPGYPVDHPAAEWLKQKEYTFYNNIKLEDFYSINFIDIIINYAKTCISFLEFLNEPLNNITE